MSKGKFESAPRPRRKGSKAAALILALVLVVGCVVGGTLAWLTAKTGEVKNVFTTADIGVTLTETTDNEYKMIPGYTIAKDPKATVVSGSEACWLFVKLEKSENFDQYLTYEMADGWTRLTEDKGGNPISDLIFYREVDGAENQIGTPYSVLEGDRVTVLGTVTKDMMKTAERNKPTLTITAYASQLHKNATEKFTAADAWANIQANIQ